MRTITCLLILSFSSLWLSCTIKEPEIAAETDRQFVLSASELNQFCMAAAQAAVTTTATVAVREYAQEVISENNAINRELTTLAWRKGIQLKELSDLKTAKIDSLQLRKGPTFDYTFIDMVADAYAEVVALYETEMEWGRDLGVQTWAKSKLPALRERLKKARDARDAL